jgi:Rad3-related DNA helicase
MLRSIQEILDQADELAKRFEDCQPGEGDQVPVEEYLLQRADRARSERKVVDAVTAARSSDISWNKIGEILGTSAQVAQQRYGAVFGQT